MSPSSWTPYTNTAPAPGNDATTADTARRGSADRRGHRHVHRLHSAAAGGINQTAGTMAAGQTTHDPRRAVDRPSLAAGHQRIHVRLQRRAHSLRPAITGQSRRPLCVGVESPKLDRRGAAVPSDPAATAVSALFHQIATALAADYRPGLLGAGFSVHEAL